jgi:hypothetical protein
LNPVDHHGYQDNDFSLSMNHSSALSNNNGSYMPVADTLSPLLPRVAHNEHQHVYKQLSINISNESATSSPTNSTPSTPISEHAPNLKGERTGADDDKRRRNTAASARFRIKKKQREQALERTAQEMTEKSDRLESRVKELELEIKWLRSLLLEKDTRQSDTAEPNAKKDSQ